MENNPKNPKETQQQSDELNANSAYSGSGSWQPGGDIGEAGKLSGNDDKDSEVQRQTDSIPGNQTDQPYTEGNPEYLI